MEYVRNRLHGGARARVDDNPDVPDWMQRDYDAALQELARIGLHEFADTKDANAIRAILSLLALVKGARTYARGLLDFTEDEIRELETDAFGDAADAQ